VQRFDGHADLALSRVGDQRGDRVLDHAPRSLDVAIRRGTADQHEHVAPSSAASSIARRLSSMRAARSPAVAAGNMPPRHTLDTCRPASRTSRRLSFNPTSAILWRQMPIDGTWARRQPSSASARLQRLVVI